LSSKANLYSGNTFTNKQIFQDVAADVFNVYRNVDLANNASAANITFSGDLTAKRDYASINSYRGSSTTGGALAFFTRTANNLSEKMRIKEDGKVGIATSAPSEILDVVGNIKLSGQLISTVTGSTAPLVVGNTTNVTNLNADLLDGFHSTDFVLTGTTINGQTLNTNVTITASGLGVYTSGETDSLLTGKTNAVMTTLGDIIIGGASGVATRLGVGSINTVLHGGSSPSYSAIVEADINLSNNTTNNVSTTKHGFAPILSNIPTQFLDGQGNWTTPTGIANSYLSQTFTSVTGVTITHNFGTYPLVQLLDSSGYEFIPLQVQHTTLNSFTVTFASSKSGTIISSVGSPQPQSLTIASGNYNILVTDRIIKCTGAGSTITLPTAVGNSGREFVIDNNSTSGINVNTTSSQTINGNPLQVLNTNNAMHVYSDGTNWRIY
jgi:hypothetical protein